MSRAELVLFWATGGAVIYGLTLLFAHFGWYG